jgi:hypothetical protein
MLAIPLALIGMSQVCLGGSVNPTGPYFINLLGKLNNFV